MDWRSKRPRGRRPQRGRDDEPLFERARDAWRDATAGEKATFVLAAGVAVVAVGSLLNTLLSFVALAVFGVFALPVFAIAASVSLVAFATAASGFAALSMFGLFGLGFVGVPLLVTGTVLLKMFGPLLVAAPAIALKWRRDARVEEEMVKVAEDEDDEAAAYGEDDFLSEFDRRLAGRDGSPLKSIEDSLSVSEMVEWSVRDCVVCLRSAGMTNAAARVSKERVDGEAFAMMTDADILYLTEGLPLGDRKRFAAFARRFRA
jgi:hypothetical protein